MATISKDQQHSFYYRLVQSLLSSTARRRNDLHEVRRKATWVPIAFNQVTDYIEYIDIDFRPCGMLSHEMVNLPGRREQIGREWIEDITFCKRSYVLDYSYDKASHDMMSTVLNCKLMVPPIFIIHYFMYCVESNNLCIHPGLAGFVMLRCTMFGGILGEKA
jgi:hypothetical protein